MAEHQHPMMKVDESGNLWLNFGEYGQEVELACFSKDGSRLLTVEKVGVAKIFDTETSELVGEIRPVSDLAGSDKSPTTKEFEVYIEAVALDSKGELALLGLNDGTAGVFEVSTGKRLSTLFQNETPPEHWELIRAVNFSNDGSIALVGFYNRTVGVWNNTGEQLLAKLRPNSADLFFSKEIWGRDSLVSSVAASADNRYVFVGCSDYTCIIWDLEKQKPVYTATEYREETINICTIADAVYWATAGGAAWRAVDNSPPEKLYTSEQNWVEAKIAPSGSFLLAVTMAGEIQKISLQDKKIDVLANIAPKELFKKRTAIGFLDGDNYFYTPSRDSIKLADITIQVIEEEEEDETHDTIKSVTLSPDNSILAIKTDWKNIGLWDRASGQFIRQLSSSAHKWAFSSDGNKIAFSTKDSERGYIQIEEARTGQLVQKFIVHGSNDVFFAFDQKDERLITGSAKDHTMRLWQRINSADSPHGKYTEVKKQTYPFNQQFIFAFLPDGKIVVGRRGGDLEVWSPELTTKFCCDIKLDYDPLWCINKSRREFIIAEHEQKFYKIDLTTGTTNCFKPQLDRPEYLPNLQLRKEFNCRNGAALWRGFGGPYVHITDGPRGWATPIHISIDQKFVVLPGQGEIAVVSIAEEQIIRARLPFEGRLRAAYVDAEKIMAVDSKGKLIAKTYGEKSL